MTHTLAKGEGQRSVSLKESGDGQTWAIALLPALTCSVNIEPISSCHCFGVCAVPSCLVLYVLVISEMLGIIE